MAVPIAVVKVVEGIEFVAAVKLFSAVELRLFALAKFVAAVETVPE
jgi:hypothetical protein